MTVKPLCAHQFMIQFLSQNLSKLPCITEWMKKHIIGSTAAATWNALPGVKVPLVTHTLRPLFENIASFIFYCIQSKYFFRSVFTPTTMHLHAVSLAVHHTSCPTLSTRSLIVRTRSLAKSLNHNLWTNQAVHYHQNYTGKFRNARIVISNEL